MTVLLAVAGASKDVPPFAVITSNDVDLAVGRYAYLHEALWIYAGLNDQYNHSCKQMTAFCLDPL